MADILQECAKNFQKLFSIQYNIIIGRKMKNINIVLGFQEVDFHHLIGLHKLKDLRIARANREKFLIKY